ncbi:hypothetical protein [Anoxynatronum buryatiense]|uniref:Uncharacterized protein n=1 Tax=Anoxynatronum buryatiense TaxID=489973 RepID=A0AA45WW35_9CLOT|nr:hypothetical protein [Anoxynatronum buryatiense]SMP57102.1 hypothetical protein SAMN06296020_106130 [Anoxynatronum buryatiense]
MKNTPTPLLKDPLALYTLSPGRKKRRSPRPSKEQPLEALLQQPDTITGFMPVHVPAMGTALEVCLLSGHREQLPMTTTTFLNALADTYLVNLRVLKRRLRDQLGINYYVPLPLTSQLVLVPVKTRHLTVKGDDVHGYVNLCALQHTTVAEDSLLLVSGQAFPCLNHQATVNRRINQAQLAVALLQQASLLKLQERRTFD